MAPAEALQDYYLCCLSRELSHIIRRDVLTGRAKFGVSDDGKELFQVAMAKVFAPGDWRADYYRGHTLLLALGLATVEDLLAQLYADADHDPFSGGRQMNNHHATPLLDEAGHWLEQRQRLNLSSDISTTGGQMARGLGLAFASKIYREAKLLHHTSFSHEGREVCFCNIGDASTSEGVFWETANAAGVLQAPLAITVADDGYGISVPKKYQTTKEDISEALAGLQPTDQHAGMAIYRIKGWDYQALCDTYAAGISRMRLTHEPALFHIDDLTQPLGHSTSGSHERYKSPERLQWEKEYDCNRQFRLWLLATGLADEAELAEAEQRAQQEVSAARRKAWDRYVQPLQHQKKVLAKLLPPELAEELAPLPNPCLSELLSLARRARFEQGAQASPELTLFIEHSQAKLAQRIHTHLYSEDDHAALRVPEVKAVYDNPPTVLNGFEILNAFFDQALARYPQLYAFGEDLGQIGGVNQGFAGLQAKYGEHRVFDTGIREWTIIGQAIGMAMRGLRPLAEIQYLDYLIYALSPLSDDLATLRWRTKGLQQAPVIVRTRGHRLEGVWHSGSPMGLLLGSLRGIYVCVPRNMVQAAGMYHTLLQGNDPGIVIECLNGYRLKEALPDNLDVFTVPLGVPEVLRSGHDLTLVTYGSCVRIAEAAAHLLATKGIEVEVVDVQTLLPFDRFHYIRKSLAKTNRLVVLDEDVPGGASAFILQHILQEQQGYYLLDSPPLTLTAAAHRPAYADDGNYLSKPSVEDVVEQVYALMQEAEPWRFI